MKDRTPKYRGRVKLLPVTGQENIYDMTRADEPDDTGTPFNTRTMLQDSTAQFLKLPVSNPFVDDALRHMPDRVNPVGTIRTTPQQSLGDAWLPCDGSQVTFSEYPELCQILRNTAGAVSWDSEAVGVSPNFMGMSRPVYFKGKWYIAGSYYQKPVGTVTRTITLNIATADNANGPYTTVKTIKETVDGDGSYDNDVTNRNMVQGAATSETIAFVWLRTTTGTDRGAGCHVTVSDDGDTWTTRTVKRESGANYDHTIWDFQTDGTYWAMSCGVGVFVLTDIKSSNTFLCKNFISNANGVGYLSYVNGMWALVAGGHSTGGSGAFARFFAATNPAGTWTEYPMGTSIGGAVSSVVYYSGAYWVFLNYGKLATSTDLVNWSIISYTAPYGGTYKLWLVASQKQMAVTTHLSSGIDTVQTTSDPDVGWNVVSLPAGTSLQNLFSDGDLFLTSGDGLIAYHDYSLDERTLPTISLSSDTTTFIKAKKELDVFEAAQIGG